MEDGPSFAELISLREAQQARVRASLAEQNELLRVQLEQRQAALQQQADSGSPGGGHAAASAAATIAVQDQFLKFFEQLEQLITKNHDADIAAFNALQDKHEAKQQALEQRLNELEQRLVSSERTKQLLREEQMSQHLTLCGDLEALRTLADTNAKRLDTRDELVASLQSSVNAMGLTAASLEERLVQVEDMPNAIREDIGDIEERFTKLSAAVTAERASIAQVRNEALERQNEEFKLLIADARSSVKAVEGTVEDLLESLNNARARVNEQISSGIQQVGADLQAQLLARLEQQSEQLREARQHLDSEHDKLAKRLVDDVVALQGRVEGALTELRSRYTSAVEEQLADVVARFEAFEEKRKSEFPTADSERVQLMLGELENAFTMLEGVARNSIMTAASSASKSNTTTQMVARLDAAEAKLEELRVRQEMAQPRVTFSVPVQASPAELDSLVPEEQLTRRVERHLQQELELAAVEHASLQARKDSVAAVNRSAFLSNKRQPSVAWSGASDFSAASNQTSRGASQQAIASARELALLTRSPSAGNYTVDRAAAASARGSSQATSEPARGSVGVPPPPLPEPRTHAAIRAQREQKEAALEKIQSVLHDIQRKFHELTEKEQRGGRETPEARRVALLIAQQKEAVYQKERQLIDHRNALWREVSALRDAEARAAAS